MPTFFVSTNIVADYKSMPTFSPIRYNKKIQIIIIMLVDTKNVGSNKKQPNNG